MRKLLNGQLSASFGLDAALADVCPTPERSEMAFHLPLFPDF